ncbi:hypothetical protein, partial [Bacteroides rodentium]
VPNGRGGREHKVMKNSTDGADRGGIGCRQGEIALAMLFQWQQPHIDKVRCLSRQTLVSKLTGTGFIAYAYKSQALLVTQYYNIMKAFMCF